MKKKSAQASRGDAEPNIAQQVEDSGVYQNEADVFRGLYRKASDGIMDGLSSLYAEMFAEMEGGGMRLISEVAAYIAWRQRRDVKALAYVVGGFNCTQAKMMAVCCWTMWDKHVLSAVERANKRRLAESTKNGRRTKAGETGGDQAKAG